MSEPTHTEWGVVNPADAKLVIVADDEDEARDTSPVRSPSRGGSMSDADRDALVRLPRAHHGDIAEPVRDSGAFRCPCGEWVAWDAWEEHLGDTR